jgi:hypothetical protein
MVVRFTIVAIVSMLACASVAGTEAPDLSDLPASACLPFVGKFVRVTGRISPNGRYGVFLDTGKVRIHLMACPQDPDPSLENQQVVVLGTLHRLALPATIPGSSTPLEPAFYFVRDYTIHYPSSWPRRPSNQTMQPTARRCTASLSMMIKLSFHSSLASTSGG